MANSARIDELRKKFDENPRRYFAPLANEYRKSGDLEQAIFICQEYLPQQPGHMSGHIVYGQALFDAGRHDEAKGVFETALSLDPENLIALRHLGDISRTAGDSALARGWYQRALEVDPRNEEITELLASLERESVAAPDLASSSPAQTAGLLEFAARVSPSESAAPTDESPAPLRAGAVDESPLIEKSQEAIPSALEHAANVDRVEGFERGGWQSDEAELGARDDIDLPPLPPAQPAPAASATGDDDLLDLEDFSFGGVPMGTTPEPRAGEPAPVGLDGDVNISGGFTLGHDEGQFEPDPFAIAASPPEPNIEPAIDINLGLTDDSAPANEAIDTPPALAGLETFEAGVIASGPIDVPLLETEAFFDLPTADEPAAGASAVGDQVDDQSADDSLSADSVSAETVSAELAPEISPAPGRAEDRVGTSEPARVEPEEAFATETMAELYIQQGHLDSALAIYQKLVEQRPADSELRDRLRAIEGRLFGAPAAAQSGPTIREFLLGFAARTPTGGARPSGEFGDEVTDSAETPTRAARMTPGASETITGSIDALFSGADASESDAAAASALAGAFTSGASEPQAEDEATQLPGTPAHRATDELSLDHVFKADTPQRVSSEADGFSFDQFFADEMTEATAEPAPDAAPGAPEGTDDIAQFNAWLNGLKKT